MTSLRTTHDPQLNPQRRHWLVVSIIVAVSVFLAACSGSADDSAGDQSAADKTSDSPIENLLGVPVFDQVAVDAWFNNLSREAETKVAACMRGQGFEYTAVGGPTAKADDAVAADSLEYAQERGFNIVAAFNEAAFTPGRDNNDANAVFVASLSESERDAYLVALRGSADFNEDEPLDPDANSGCIGDATDEVFGVLAVFDAIGPTFDSYYDLYISDSRIIETNTLWQRCMSEKGHLYSDENDVLEQFARELDGIASDEAAFKELDVEALGVAPGADGGFNFHPGLTPEAQAKVDGLGEREIETAVAHWECIEPHRDVQLKVQREYEEQFVTEVGPQVAAIRAES